ncbi:ApeA N-terminal domain 1-containing protein [Streptomyces sp. NPDC003015]
MEYFEAHGAWFLPGGSHVAGVLTFSPDGLVLKVLGPLLQESSANAVDSKPASPRPARFHPSFKRRRGGNKSGRRSTRRGRLGRVQHLKDRQNLTTSEWGIGSTQWGTLPFIHGFDQQQRKITLVGCFGMVDQWPEITEQTFNVTLTLIGDHLASTDFSGIRAQFNHLADWSQAPEIAHTQKKPNTLVINRDSTEIMRTSWRGARLSIRSGILGNSSNGSVHLERYCMFTAEHISGSWVELLDAYLKPFQDLLILCLGRHVHMTEMELSPAGSDRWLDAYFNMVAPQKAQQLSSSSVHGYNSPTLLTAESADKPLTEVVSSWFELHEKLKPVITLLLSSLYAPFTYGEHRYSSIFQSVEAYHKIEKSRFGDGKEIPTGDHRKRVKAVVSALKDADLPQEHIQWAKNVIQGRNDKPLKSQIKEVVASTASFGQHIFKVSPTLCDYAYDARTGVSHGAAERGTSASSRYWIGEVLLWVMRVRLLQDLGITRIGKFAVSRPRFEYALEQANLAINQD